MTGGQRIVGAGPAGLHAALADARAGARVTLVDNGARVGGQYHRHAPPTGEPNPGHAQGSPRPASPADAPNPGHAQASPRPAPPAGGPGRVPESQRLARAVAAHPAIDQLPHTTAWSIEPARGAGGGASAPHLVHVLTGPADGFRTPRALAADALVPCPGAFDRALPFPGWDLPGVVTADAAQALAKGQRLAVGRRVIVAGTGPFLLPVAAALLGAGARVLGVWEAGSPAGWLRSPLPALRDGRGKLPELAS